MVHFATGKCVTYKLNYDEMKPINSALTKEYNHTKIPENQREYLRCELTQEAHEIKASIVNGVIGISDDSVKRVHSLIEQIS